MPLTYNQRFWAVTITSSNACALASTVPTAIATARGRVREFRYLFIIVPLQKFSYFLMPITNTTAHDANAHLLVF